MTPLSSVRPNRPLAAPVSQLGSQLCTSELRTAANQLISLVLRRFLAEYTVPPPGAGPARPVKVWRKPSVIAAYANIGASAKSKAIVPYRNRKQAVAGISPDHWLMGRHERAGAQSQSSSASNTGNSQAATSSRQASRAKTRPPGVTELAQAAMPWPTAHTPSSTQIALSPGPEPHARLWPRPRQPTGIAQGVKARYCRQASKVPRAGLIPKPASHQPAPVTTGPAPAHHREGQRQTGRPHPPSKTSPCQRKNR